MYSLKKMFAGVTMLVVFASIASLSSCNASDSTKTHAEVAVEATIDPNTVFIDVRTPEEFASGHVDGALNIPVSEINAVQEHVADKDTPVVLYCRSGNRAGRALTAMQNMGYTDVVNAGGLQDARNLKKEK